MPSRGFCLWLLSWDDAPFLSHCVSLSENRRLIEGMLQRSQNPHSAINCKRWNWKIMSSVNAKSHYGQCFFFFFLLVTAIGTYVVLVKKVTYGETSGQRKCKKIYEKNVSLVNLGSHKTLTDTKSVQVDFRLPKSFPCTVEKEINYRLILTIF